MISRLLFRYLVVVTAMLKDCMIMHVRMIRPVMLFLPPLDLCVVPSLWRDFCEAQLTEADLSEPHGDRKSGSCSRINCKATDGAEPVFARSSNEG